jgi:D-arabinose 1-dehydrogenase-like Zn-dependent alcohol dehydrogenase
MATASSLTASRPTGWKRSATNNIWPELKIKINQEGKSMYKTKAYSATSATSQLAGATIPRRDPTEHDVQIEILFCGICHSDLHSVRNEWSEFMPTVYPIVPGHEIVGRVTKVGTAVTKYKPGEPGVPPWARQAHRRDDVRQSPTPRSCPYGGRIVEAESCLH